MNCPHCGFEDEGNFCSNCGNPLTESKDLTTRGQQPDITKGWHVSISFGKSTSKNFTKALAMAKSAPQYIESTDEKGNPIYQAIYGPKDYLSFISLYELISNWKSTFVFINGEMVDRKIVGALNYCYGDKLRSGNPDFCFGASQFTENPFGCHRAQMHQSNDPWYSYGIMDTKRCFHIDKERIKNELFERLKPYRFCPALDIEKAIQVVDQLPSVINPQKDDNWEYTTYHDSKTGSSFEGVIPKEHSTVYTININLDMDNFATDDGESKQNDGHKKIQSNQSDNSKTKTGSGCLLPVIIVFLVLVLTAFTLN
ncbi:MAG: hypothetical protein K9L17_02835 [Clostridiales bacterium]|nr:hypothetical protein [Clostridiales bacterium]MCF8021616.1 hypothetical protein [Clostridiales bacterium]